MKKLQGQFDKWSETCKGKSDISEILFLNIQIGGHVSPMCLALTVKMTVFHLNPIKSNILNHKPNDLK